MISIPTSSQISSYSDFLLLFVLSWEVSWNRIRKRGEKHEKKHVAESKRAKPSFRGKYSFWSERKWLELVFFCPEEKY